MSSDHEQTASIMTPAKLARFQPRPAVTPGGWLDQLAADAGAEQLTQLGAQASQLAQLTTGRDDQPLQAALDALGAALAQVDFGLLEPKGWLARATGKAKSAGAEFNGQFEQVTLAAEAVRQQVQALARQQQADVLAAERLLLEFEVECSAVGKLVEQGARWLRDMRTQLKARQAQGGDAAFVQAIRDDAARCESLVARLKLLKAAGAAAQAVQQAAQARASRRAVGLQSLQQALLADSKTWLARIGPLASNAGASGGPALGMEGPAEAHRQFQVRVKQLQGELAQWPEHDRALAASLAELAQQLRAAT